jgi:hypothetical protein
MQLVPLLHGGGREQGAGLGQTSTFGRVRAILQSKHQVMTASMVHVTNLTLHHDGDVNSFPPNVHRSTKVVYKADFHRRNRRQGYP